MTYQASLTLSQKGQIALPAVLRKLLNLEPKSQLVLEWSDEGLVQIKKPDQTIEQVIGSLPFRTPGVEITRERITKAQEAHYKQKNNYV